MSDYRLPAWIPEEVSDALKAAADSHWNGKVEIHFNDGHPVEIHATRKVKVKRPAPTAAAKCPECHRPMESKDYGALWVCQCGVKRTRSQMEKLTPYVGVAVR